MDRFSLNFNAINLKFSEIVEKYVAYNLRIGDLSGEVDQRIIDLGFTFTNEITVLGFILKNSGSMVAKNFENSFGYIWI